MKSIIVFKTLVPLLLLLRPANNEIIKKKIPNDFLLGAATSAYQIEGGWDADGKSENIWDRYAHTQFFKISGFANGDVACDSYHKYLEDVEMLKYLGVTHYRFSISWARILPTGHIYKVNQAGVDYYKNLIRALKENGIEPFVTMYHGELPQTLQDMGGWLNPLLIDYFTDYANLLFTLYGDDVKNWMTFNEPKQVCVGGYGDGVSAPAVKSPGINDYLCAHNLLKAHAKAYHIYGEGFRSVQNGRISIVLDTTWYEPENDSDLDTKASERAMQFYLGWFANPLFNGNYPQVMIDRIAERSQKQGFLESRLPVFTAEEIEYIKGTLDFIGLNFYLGSTARWREDYDTEIIDRDADISVESYSNASWENGVFTPRDLRKLVNWVDQSYNHPEIIITENGYFGSSEELDDQLRIEYHTQHLSSILEALYEDDVNVSGYTAWSLMDNFEWGYGYTVKFGLYHVDFDSPNRTRTAKKSVDFYKNVIATKCLLDTCED